jgi:hypothetical protein
MGNHNNVTKSSNKLFNYLNNTDPPPPPPPFFSLLYINITQCQLGESPNVKIKFSFQITFLHTARLHMNAKMMVKTGISLQTCTCLHLNDKDTCKPTVSQTLFFQQGSSINLIHILFTLVHLLIVLSSHPTS